MKEEGVELPEVDDAEEHQSPAHDDELHEAVVQDDLGGVAALLVNHSNLDEAQQAKQHEDAGEVEIARLETTHHLRRHGVHDVADEHNRAGDGDGLVDEGHVVADGVLARRLSRLVHAQHVVAPLGERQEESQQEGHQHNPAGELHVNGNAADQHTEHEAEGDDADIDDGIVFQLLAVGDVQQPVEDDDARDLPAVLLQEEEGKHGEGEHEHHQDIGLGHADGTRCNGTATLHGMAAVGLHIHQVVKAVDGRGGEAECHKGDEPCQQGGGVKEFATKEHRQQHKDILGPLLRANQFEEIFYLHILFIIILSSS